MNNLTLLTNELIPVYKNEKGSKLVNARELHEWLGSGQDFSDWIKNRIEQYDFMEDTDFTIILGKSNGGRPSKEYIITLDMAKELSMVERTDKGKEARQYFIKCEEKLKEITTDVSQLSLETQLLLKLSQSIAQQEIANKQIEKAVQETKQEVQAIREVVEIKPSENWRDETNSLIKKICYHLKDYRTPKDEIYKALEQRAGCNLKTRLNNLRGRAFDNCWSQTKINNLNYLDVIQEDKKLIEIYVAIVKDMAIRNGVRV